MQSSAEKKISIQGERRRHAARREHFGSKMIHWAQSAKLAPKASLDLVVIIVMVVVVMMMVVVVVVDDGKSTKNLCEIDARLSALWSGPVYKV